MLFPLSALSCNAHAMENFTFSSIFLKFQLELSTGMTPKSEVGSEKILPDANTMPIVSNLQATVSRPQMVSNR